MFYRPEDGHPLTHNPFKAIVSPRPIAWISTQDAKGVRNLAPYSFFNAIADAPPQVMFSSLGSKADQAEGKDTLSNIQQTGVFCVNLVQKDMMQAMNISCEALGKAVDEFEAAGLEARNCETIDCPRLAQSPAALECKLMQVIPLKGAHNFMVTAEVCGIHLRDDTINNGRFEVTRFQPLARLGYHDYAAIEETFELQRPK